MKTKKVTRRYEVSRAQLEERLGALADAVGDIDTYDLSPTDVASELTRLRDELENLASDMLSEK